MPCKFYNLQALYVIKVELQKDTFVFTDYLGSISMRFKCVHCTSTENTF